MSLTKSGKITKQLHFAYNVVTNSLGHEEILSLLEVRGFPRTSFDRGKSLYEAATKSVGAKLVLEDELEALEDRIHIESALFTEHYLSFVKAAKTSFGRSALTMLELPSKLPRAGNAFCESAQATFNRVLENPDLVQHLTKTGWDDAQIRSVCTLIESYEKAMKRQPQLKNALAQATGECDRALAALRSWLAALSTAAVTSLDSNPHLLEVIEVDVKELYSFASPQREKAPQRPELVKA